MIFISYALIAQDMFELAISPSASELEELFLTKYGEDCSKVFMQEIAFIIGLYHFFVLRPTRDELKNVANYTIKGIGKHLEGIEKYLANVQEKTRMDLY